MTGARIILHGDDLEGMVKAAREAVIYEQREGRPGGDCMGMRIGSKYYSVQWNKTGISVWQQTDEEPAP